MMQDNEVVMLGLPAESALLLVDIIDRDREKGICQVNSYRYTCTIGYVNLLKQ